ncbi:peptidase [uncultured Rothia sp.]|uniref:peptidase n=1 Tax=uncultured Rothia sp. TaxID=316088 RepID=UPI002617A39C|nr:peptidase [uncultured Rothia sp.]
MSGPSGENNTVSLYYEPLDAGTLDRLLALRPLEIEELVTLARSLHEAIETLLEAGERYGVISAEYVGLTAGGKPRLLLPESSYIAAESAPQKNTEPTSYAWAGEYVRSAAVLLWRAACGHDPEPAEARVPLSLRLGPGIKTEADRGADWSTDRARNLGRALEYLLDAPAARLARIGLNPVLDLDLDSRPINVYLSCSERARMLIPAAPEREDSARDTPLEKTREKVRKFLETRGVMTQRGKSGRHTPGRARPPATHLARRLVNADTGADKKIAKGLRLNTPMRLGATALTLAALATSAGMLTLNGGEVEASAQVHAASAESSAARDAPDVSAAGERENPGAVLRALLDQRNRERRARGGAELTLESIEDSAGGGEDLRIVAVVSASGYRPSAEEKQARKLSEENGITRQKVIFELHRGEQGWEIVRAEPV